MEPTETGFKEPTLDFFRPNKVGGILVGVEFSAAGDMYPLRINCGKPENYHDARLNGVVKKVYANDLGGITFEFSDEVKYVGLNQFGSVILERDMEAVIPDNAVLPPKYVARVRKPDGTVVWENDDVPKSKKQLKAPVPVETPA